MRALSKLDIKSSPGASRRCAHSCSAYPYMSQSAAITELWSFSNSGSSPLIIASVQAKTWRRSSCWDSEQFRDHLQRKLHGDVGDEIETVTLPYLGKRVSTMRRTRSSSRSTDLGVKPRLTSCRCRVCSGGSSEMSSGSDSSSAAAPLIVNGSGRLENTSGLRDAATTSACRTIAQEGRPSRPVSNAGQLAAAQLLECCRTEPPAPMRCCRRRG